MSELINMDGYGIYVWPAYGVTLCLILGLVGRTALRQYHLFKQERDFEQRNKAADY